jgi:hypothetical protein
MCVQSESTVDEAVQQLTDRGVLQPVLFHVQDRFFIKADHSAIPISDAACFADCVEFLFMTYFVFAVQYPHDLRLVFGLLEKIMGVPSTIGKSSVLATFMANV